jgi:hypothetical protein
MNLKIVYYQVFFILLAIVLACLCPHPILWLFFILLLIAFLPTLLCNLDLLRLAYIYTTHKQGRYKELREDGCNLLDRHFKVKIIGQQDYEKPVIFIVNHSFNDFVSDSCLLKIKSKNKIIKVTRAGRVQKLFNNIEHIYINSEGNNRTQQLLDDVKKAKEDGYSVIIFPEGQNCVKKQYWRQLMPFRNGTFVLAKELDMLIVPVIITAGRYNNGLVKYGPIKIQYLDLINPNDYDLEELKDHCYNVMSQKLKYIDILA